MSPHAVELMYEACYLIFMLSMPPILAAAIVGLLFALLQAVTQLQEQTLSFAVKLFAVTVTLFLTADHLSEELLRFSSDIFNSFFRL